MSWKTSYVFPLEYLEPKDIEILRACIDNKGDEIKSKCLRVFETTLMESTSLIYQAIPSRQKPHCFTHGRVVAASWYGCP